MGPTPPRMPLEGERFGRYLVTRQLHAGNYSRVFSAKDHGLGREVILKLLDRGVAHSRLTDDAAERLQREANALARVSHPNVVTIHDFGEHDGIPFICMESVEGQPLQKWLAATPRPWTEILDVMLRAGTGLAAAHDAGLVHRDIKPSNIVVGPFRQVKVIDFGFAKSAPRPTNRPPEADEDRLPTMTLPGVVLGTMPFIAPEQLEGHPADALTDQFAFCTCLFQALYGFPPFTGKSAFSLYEEVMAENVRPAPRRSRVPMWLRRQVIRGLCFARESRHPSVRSLVASIVLSEYVLALR